MITETLCLETNADWDRHFSAKDTVRPLLARLSMPVLEDTYPLLMISLSLGFGVNGVLRRLGDGSCRPHLFVAY